MSESDSEEKTYMKCPTWDGTTAKFKHWQVKMPAYLTLKGMGKALTTDAPLDSEDLKIDSADDKIFKAKKE